MIRGYFGIIAKRNIRGYKRKLNFITNQKKIYYYMYMNMRTLEDKMICNFLVGNYLLMKI